MSEPHSPDSGPDRDTDRASATSDRHAQHAAVGTLQGFAAGLIAVPAGLVSAALLTRALGPEGYGLLAVTIAIVTWVQVAVLVGLDRAAIRLVAQSSAWRVVATRLAQIQLGVAIIAAVGVVAVAGLVAAGMGKLELAGPLRWAALDIPLLALSTIYCAILVGRGRFGPRAIVSIVFWIARVSLVVIVAAFFPTVEAAVLAIVGASLAAFIAARLFARVPILVQVEYPSQQIWQFAWPLFFYAIFVNLFGSMDLLFVGAFDPSPEAPGFFGAARNLTIVPATFAGAVAPMLLAKLTELSERGDRPGARAMAVRSMRVALCMLPFAAMTAGCATEIVTLIYGADFSPSASMLSPLIFAAIGGSLVTIAASMLIASGRPGLTTLLAAPLAIAALVALALVVPRYGAVGAAHATNALSWVGALWAVVLVHPRWPMSPLWASALRCAICCVPAYGVAMLWPTPGPWLVAKLVAISALIGVSLIATREIDRRDLTFLRNLLRRSSPADGSTPK